MQVFSTKEQDYPSLLQKWAILRTELPVARPRLLPGWEAAHRLIVAARQKLDVNAECLRNLLKQSRQQLQPLEDPFDIDLEDHRWLAFDREEVYSDWFQWVIAQTRTPERVFHLLDIKEPPDLPDWQNLPFTVGREITSTYGHPGHEGRMDVVVRYGDKVLIVVEVKVIGADKSDTGKHEGYDRQIEQWVREQSIPNAFKVLVAVDATQQTYGGFSFVSWAHVCVELRGIASTFSKREKVITAAMILAFVAAVEQNILGFSAAAVRSVHQGRFVPFNSLVIDHISKSLLEEA